MIEWFLTYLWVVVDSLLDATSGNFNTQAVLDATQVLTG